MHMSQKVLNRFLALVHPEPRKGGVTVGRDWRQCSCCIGSGCAVDYVLDVCRKETINSRGIFANDRVEILGGVMQGDVVIVANLASFVPGETVTPKHTATGETNSSAGEDQ